MASIPCAAYQASHIHAHMRRQNIQARARHPSGDSTSSAASDSGLAAGPLSQSSLSQVSLRDRMDRVSQWVGDGIKRFRSPLLSNGVQIHTKLPLATEGSVAMPPPAISMPPPSLSSQSSMCKSDV